ncbi:uncharacterized protein LY79DRAFT_666888 [Colletotrichum navitas]|uniref:Pentatricopeptide repeat domain-containing protein n=1 Tax=Colletotrichum navitas TaxID=681940 RepID=A0AAD8Q725_9PEZI|nr:uncharacterized protein LY79DRAFT_666888 [Colletotrichum navitas]KAK1597143.1 hypothetical protein LY79DRAFT_666888 [Colletotrichum navitas]
MRRLPRQHRVLSTTASASPSVSPTKPSLSTRRLSRSQPFSSEAPNASANKRCADSPETQLAHVLRAVQSQNTNKILSGVVALARHQHQIQVADALHSLPPTAFSAIVRSLDPSRVGPRSDATHGLRIPSGLGQFSSVASVADQYGVRKIYTHTFHALRSLFDLRSYHGSSPSRADYVVLLRCAGAASDFEAAKAIWHGAMKGDPVTDPRDGSVFAEYFKTRFLTDPTYAQNDLARFRMRPRNIGKNRKRFDQTRLLWPLEKLRLSVSSRKRDSFGRAPWLPTHDMHRLVSLPAPVRRLQGYAERERKVVDEEFYCAYLLASARAGSFQDMIGLLWRTWKIKITDLRDHRAAEITGGVQRSSLNPLLQPTERLIHGIVQSFGCTGHVILAKKLIIYISQRWQIPIPQSSWSALLEWTYILSSKPASQEWKIMGDANRIIRADEVLSLWQTMKSEPYLVNVGLHETDIYVKSLISAGRPDEAWEAIKQGCAEYDVLCEEVEQALFESLYPSPPPDSIARHQQLKARQHMAWYTIQNWCQQWLRQTSKRLRHRAHLAPQIIPQFVGDFHRFLPDPITYTTNGGVVRIANTDTNQKTMWVRRIVQSPPTQRLAPDPSRPRYAKPAGGSDPEELVPVLTQAGDPVYESMPITIRKTMNRMVRQRRQARFGQDEGFLRSGKATAESDADMDEADADRLDAETGPGGARKLDRRVLLRALTW